MPDLAEGRHLDRYLLGPRLGAGGFGTVYRARHTILGTEVALKVLAPQHAASPELVQRFLREAKAAASIGSPHIVTVHDAGVVEGVPFLAMEILEGEDLETRIARGGVLSVDEAIDVVLQVLAGLSAAHARGIVHRDMKPANVFLTRRAAGSFVKILDFGISKIVESEARRITQTGAVLGTPAYMAPEQIVDMRGVDARADLYAVGVILFEALTGRLPYPATTLADLMARLGGVDPVPLNHYLGSAPPELDAVISRALSVEPDRRFASADAMAHALSAVRAPDLVARAPVDGLRGTSTGPLAESAPAAAFEAIAAPARAFPVTSVPAPSAELPVPSDAAPPTPRPKYGLAIDERAWMTPSAPFSGAHAASGSGMAPPMASSAWQPPAPRRARWPWIAGGVLALVLPLACIAGIVLTLELEPRPTPHGGPSVAPSPPAPGPRIDIGQRRAPPAPSSPRVEEVAPAEGPPVAAPIPAGLDACAVPVTHAVDCDRAWDEQVPASCTSEARELHLVGSYGPGEPDGVVIVDVARTVAPIVLVLSSYSSTHWRLRLAEGARVERVIATGYERGRVDGLPEGVQAEWHEARISGWPPIAFSWEGMNARWSGRELAATAERETNLHMRSYVGCYEPTRFVIGQRAP